MLQYISHLDFHSRAVQVLDSLRYVDDSVPPAVPRRGPFTDHHETAPASAGGRRHLDPVRPRDALAARAERRLDSACIGQNVALYRAAQRLAATTRGAIDDSKLARARLTTRRRHARLPAR